ncbi:MAG: hypothetical protein ACJ8HI_17895 [Massilia sp.]
MHTMRFVISAVLMGYGCVASVAPAIAAAASTVHPGAATVKLQHVYATQPNGSPDPAHDAACKSQLSSVQSKYLGMSVATKYSIDPKTLMMSAKSSFPSPVATQPLELAVDMNPLGIAGSYSFGSFRPASLPGAYAVLFSVNQKYADPKSTFLVFGSDKTYNCLISSAKAPFKAAESAKYGDDAK